MSDAAAEKPVQDNLYTCGLPYFSYRLAVTAKRFDRAFIRVLEANGDLNLPQWRVMAQLGLSEPGTVRSLADGAAVDRAEVSRAIAQLENAGLVVREANARDQRSPFFRLTVEGLKTYERVREPVTAFAQKLVGGVDPKDVEAADRVLDAILRNCAG